MQNNGSAIVRQLQDGVAYNNRGLYVLGYSLTSISFGYALLSPGEAEVWARVDGLAWFLCFSTEVL